MTLPQNVQYAVKLLDYTSVPLTTENNLRAWQTIRAHLTSQEAEIARLREDRDSHQRVAIKAESRLAAANALLQRTQMKDYDAAAWLRLGVEIQAHLSENIHG